MKVYMFLARLSMMLLSAENTGNQERVAKYQESLKKAVEEFLPSGSGFDGGCEIRSCNQERMVINTCYHHMVEGMYDGWTNHKVTVYPSLTDGFSLEVSGRDRNGIKCYIRDTFYEALDREISKGVYDSYMYP